MNLNEVIQELPIVIKGRFAGGANASWIMWAGDIINRINRAFPGLGRVRKAPVRLMKSGFIRTPGYLAQIGNVYVDGKEVRFTQQANGIWLDGDDLDSQGLIVSSSEHPAAAFASSGEAAKLLPTNGAEALAADFPPQVFGLLQNDGTPSPSWFLSEVTGIDGDDAAVAEALIGRAIIETDEMFRISAITVVSTGFFSVNFEFDPESSFVGKKPITGMADDAYLGWAFASDSDFFEVIGSKWIPRSKTGNYAEDFWCSVDFKEPARTFSTASGAMFKSNVVAKGYAMLRRPASMTEELDLPVQYRDLLAMGMRLKAEIDMAPAGADAGAVMALFEKELRSYAVDHQNADGKSVKRAFNCSPRLGRYSR